LQGQMRRSIQVRGERQRLLDQIPGMAAAQRNFPGSVVVDQQPLDETALRRRAERGAATGEDGLEIIDGRAVGANLVRDAAQERFVDQFSWPNVGGKDDQRHERQLELLPALKRKKIDTRLERE